MATYISNAFSLNMLSIELSIGNRLSPYITEISLDFAKEIAEKAISVVGHADTAAVLSDQLGLPIAFNRTSLDLKIGDTLLVGQYVGPRLPEGTKTLPEGSMIKWILVTV